MSDDAYGKFELDLLRSWQLRRDGVPVHVAARQQRLIAALAVRGPCLRTLLVGLLWPEYPDVRALESLRVSIHLVSRQVQGLIVNDGPVLSLAGGVDVDLHRLRQGITAVRAGGALASGDLVVLREYRGAFLLPGWYEDWVVFEQDRLQQGLLQALVGISRKALLAADADTAVEAAEAALEIEPLYEVAVMNLIAANLKRGSPVAALRGYERFRGRLEKEFGLMPSASLTALIDTVRQIPADAGGLVPAADPGLGSDPTLNHP